ncbi:MarR family winged helix-turn-helix transcriptional regulator [Hymenobacter crusticola]|uniref:MarR family transcriptional regulator n=1 Tax=Hymenobacter crusticola TaxID=1770526 RepID=A0A2C9ZU06_9BACT|nr:MarR family transcriptional regulator [Hymenobacter crusticola]OUJ70424.1 MarR family transcriptional regulator [Hymenobacter crusticola]
MKDKPIFSYTQPEENTGYLLWQVTMGWHLRMNQHLRPLGLTLTQFSLLAGLYWLSRQGEVVTQQRLADYATTDKMMTSKVLQTLERKGLVERHSHQQDGRAKTLQLTAAGESLLRQAQAVMEPADAQFFGALQAEAGLFNQLLARLMS